MATTMIMVMSLMKLLMMIRLIIGVDDVNDVAVDDDGVVDVVDDVVIDEVDNDDDR